MNLALLLAHAGDGGLPHWEWPPLHPILVNFTAALVPASFVSDALARVLRRESLRSAAWWMLFYAAAVTPLTAAAGWFWLDDMGGMDHEGRMGVHKWLGTALAGVFVLLAWWRGRLHARGRAPGTLYLLAAGAVVAALTVQGHVGGMMSFGPGHGTEQTQPADGSAPTGHGETGHDHGIRWRDHIDAGG